jgi:hypothetical protein
VDTPCGTDSHIMNHAGDAAARHNYSVVFHVDETQALMVPQILPILLGF